MPKLPVVEDRPGEVVDVGERILPAGKDIDPQAVPLLGRCDGFFDPLAPVTVEDRSVVGELAKRLGKADKTETETDEKRGADYEL